MTTETPVQYSERVAREAAERNAAIGVVPIPDNRDFYAALSRAGLTADEVCAVEQLVSGGYRVTLLRGGVVRDIR